MRVECVRECNEDAFSRNAMRAKKEVNDSPLKIFRTKANRLIGKIEKLFFILILINCFKSTFYRNKRLHIVKKLSLVL